ncbi:MAG: hypothetical protein ACI4SN_01490 [Lachnospiraceae bacterium]
MKDQYRKETSQIHAPADLIQKTKQAMQQEEQRLKESEKRICGPDSTVDIQNGITVDRSKRTHNFPRGIFRWTLPLAAAASILILLSVSTVMRSSKSDSSASDMMAESEYAKDMGMQFGEADIAEDAAEESEILINESPARSDGNDMAEDYAMAEAAEDAAYPEEMENAESEVSEESETSAGYQDMEAKKDKAETADVMNRGEAAGQEQGSEIEITDVEEEPDFYDSPDTESFLYRNLLFWLIQDDEGWTAYVSVRGDKYVISGAIADREEFLERAYELLVDTRGSLR